MMGTWDGPVLRTRSGVSQSGSISKQFQQIVSGADELPLALDTRETSETEATEAASFLDLTEHGFDRGFAQGIQKTSHRAEQSFAHAHGVLVFRNGRRQRCVGRLHLRIGRDQYLNALEGRVPQTGRIPVSGI